MTKFFPQWEEIFVVEHSISVWNHNAIIEEDTVPGMLDVAFEKYANRDCIGDLKGNKRTPPYRWKTYKEIRKLSKTLAYFLSKIHKVPTRASLGICALNSWKWMVADFASSYC